MWFSRTISYTLKYNTRRVPRDKIAFAWQRPCSNYVLSFHWFLLFQGTKISRTTISAKIESVQSVVQSYITAAHAFVTNVEIRIAGSAGRPQQQRREQGWRSGESARLPPMWPGFDSRTRRHMWVEFVVGSLLCSERFFSGYSGFSLSSKTNISKFQFDLECTDISERVLVSPLVLRG